MSVLCEARAHLAKAEGVPCCRRAQCGVRSHGCRDLIGGDQRYQREGRYLLGPHREHGQVRRSQTCCDRAEARRTRHDDPCCEPWTATPAEEPLAVPGDHNLAERRIERRGLGARSVRGGEGSAGGQVGGRSQQVEHLGHHVGRRLGVQKRAAQDRLTVVVRWHDEAHLVGQ